MAMSRGGSSASASSRAERRSWLARVIQSRTSSRANSSIELASLVKDLMKQRGPQVLVAIYLGARRNNHILGHPQATQTTMRPLRAASRGLIAVAHEHH